MDEPLISVAMRETLERLALRLHESAVGDFWLVPLKATRCYVLAVHLGHDPVRALGKLWFGADYPLYDADPTWLDPDQRHRSRTHTCVTWAKACAGLRLNIPLASGVRA